MIKSNSYVKFSYYIHPQIGEITQFMCVFSHLMGIMVTELHFGNGITITELPVFTYPGKYIRDQHKHWDNVSVKYEWNLCKILMETVYGFRNMYIPFVACTICNM